MPTSSDWSPRELRLRKWVLDNPGTCKEIATKCRVSSEYVRLVLYGKRGGTRKGKTSIPKAKLATTPKMALVVRSLKQKGAPLA